MNRFSLASLVTALIASGLAAIADRTSAAEISVFTSGAPAEVQKSLAPGFTATTGHRVAITVDTLRAIQDRAAAGSPDVVVLPGPAIDVLGKGEKLRSGSRVEVARVGIGVAVREGAPLPDVSTVDGLRRTLLEARSIVYPDPKGGGFTGAHIARAIERMGIADAINPKVRLLFAIGGGVAAVAKGEADVGLFNISEIVPVKGVVLAGPWPAELQSYIVFAGAIHSRSASPDAALAYLRSLSDARARDAWTKGGFEPLGNRR